MALFQPGDEELEKLIHLKNSEPPRSERNVVSQKSMGALGFTGDERYAPVRPLENDRT